MSAVSELQTRMGVNADGVLGPNTAKAIRNFYKLTDEQAAHFLGQIAHETAYFSVFTENLNYSARGLMKTFSKYFPTLADAEEYDRMPQMIANCVYANRMGNGDYASGEGWKFRGRGALQLTGKNNYDAFKVYLGLKTLNPDDVATKYAFDSAKWFFDKNHLWSLTTAVSDYHITAVTKKVNGGTNGLADRIAQTKKFYKWLTS